MNALEEKLSDIMRSFERGGGSNEMPRVQASSPWALRIECRLSDGCLMIVRNLRSTDEHVLLAFRHELSVRSRELFCPYPWDGGEKLAHAFTVAAQASENRRDFSCLMLVGDRPIGHFFLWQAGTSATPQTQSTRIPELGIGISDAFQQRGLGRLAVNIMQAVAQDLGCDAIELTTATDNSGGWHTYLKAGFAFTGMIRNPLGVDVTAAADGNVRAETFRMERQMVYVIHESRRTEILSALENKRNAFGDK